MRISQMLEHSLSCSYIMVDGHLRRHDPSHIVTYRIQCKINEFADCLIKACIPCLSSKWKQYLQTLEMMVCQLVPKLCPKLANLFLFVLVSL